MTNSEMMESEMIKPDNCFLIGIYESMKYNLKPDERIIWIDNGSGVYPMIVKRSCVALWLEKVGKEILRLVFGIRTHLRDYRRRVK